MYLKNELYELIRTDESIFDFIQEAALDGLFYWDLENPENRWMNARYWSVLGYDPDEMPHKTSAWQNIMNQDDLKIAKENLAKHTENQEHPYDQVVRYTHKNGSTLWVRCRGMAIRDENGKAIRMLGAHHDITGLKRAEEKHAQAERAYWDFFNSIDDAVFIQEIDTGAILDVNDSMLKQFGYERDDIPNLSIADLSAAEEAYSNEHVIDLLQRASKGETIVFEWLCKKKNGRLFPGEVILKPAYLGGFERIMAVFRDITERKRAEDKLRKSEESSRKKIQTILEPKGDIGKLNLGDIIDRASLQALIEDFYRIAKVPSAMVDIAGETLIEVGFQDICVKFHRNHPESMKNCHEAATVLADGVAPGTFKAYRCKNNLLDIVTPITIGGKHMGNIFIGQFLYEDETPDYEVFKSQACQYGFNEAEYLSALDRIPRLSKEMVEATISFYSRLAGMISSLSYSKINLSRTLAERKRAEKERELFKTIADNSLYGKAIADIDGNVVYVNDYFAKIHDYNKSELIGKHLSVFHNEKQMKEVDRFNDSMIKNEYVTPIEVWHIKRDGTEFPTLMTGVTVKDEIRNTTFLAVSAIDITQQKQTEADLIIAKEKAEESDRLKSAFLANMSHEIRTPMNGILGFAELLKEPGLQDDKQQQYLAVIERSGRRMLNIINDIVDISRIEAGYVEVNIKDSDINEMIQELFDFFKPEAEAKALNLSLNNPFSEKEAIIKTDREKTYAVLANLVKNAIKYTEEGKIEFGIDHKEDFLEFYVKDTGIGIPEDRQEAVFNRFVQADIEDKMARQGAGLGLAISKAYVEMLGGNIWLESQEGKGSTFYFTLPCNALQVNAIIHK